jgi:oligopeptide transport system ATP-binding protein
MSALTQDSPATAGKAGTTVLKVEGLTVDLRTGRGTVRAVDNVGFEARAGETLALLGESGCGKSMTAKAVAGLLDPIADVTGGEIVLNGTDLAALSPRQRRKFAGPELGIVFQDALTALNPVYPVGTQLGEAFRIHHKLSAKQAKEKAIELMKRVGIPEPESRVNAYPHQFSGGMRQRILIAMAVALNPRLLIADEPTTALDVTVQAQIMALLRSLREESDMAVVLITHDLAVVAEEADSVAIMYAGNVVETGRVADVFSNPRHPYTKGLLESVPVHAERGGELNSIPGSPPELHNIPPGCVYQSRCPMAQEICRAQRPEMLPVNDDGGNPGRHSARPDTATALPVTMRAAACHFSEELDND